MRPTFPQRVDIRVWRNRIKARRSLRRLWRSERIRRDFRRDYGISPYCCCGQVHRANGRAVMTAWRRVFVWTDERWATYYAELGRNGAGTEPRFGLTG